MCQQNKSACESLEGRFGRVSLVPHPAKDHTPWCDNKLMELMQEGGIHGNPLLFGCPLRWPPCGNTPATRAGRGTTEGTKMRWGKETISQPCTWYHNEKNGDSRLGIQDKTVLILTSTTFLHHTHHIKKARKGDSGRYAYTTNFNGLTYPNENSHEFGKCTIV